MPEVQEAIAKVNAAIAAVCLALPVCQEAQKLWRIEAIRDNLTNVKLTLEEILLITN